ncbi:DUF6134 family protein [Pontibacter sp. G13]|uniref:DUF6134 family protein n=1 Tax=Pontibacter sp. G13 TaxID=3074898 RepID=UPI00288BDC81|nr:DUF6134 family protein [Pontibacter sp. G13]WNJ19801.1 DUF6134 family protein [Pontibacter sp. G13]
MIRAQICLVWCLTGLLGSPLMGQTLLYKVYKGQTEVGWMRVNKVMQDGNEHFSLDCNMDVKMMFSMNLQFTYEANFQSGHLTSSLTRNFRNGSEKSHSEGKRVNHIYRTIRDGKAYETPADIDFCIIRTYWEEPVGRSQVFSERWGHYLPFEQVGPHKYRVLLPTGNYNYMTYREGKCVELQVNHTLATLFFRLVE